MESSIFLALVAAIFSAACAADHLSVTFSQVPTPVNFRGKVTVICSTPVANLDKRQILRWKLPGGTEIEPGISPGVTDTNFGRNLTTASSILKLNLDGFPPAKQVSCGAKDDATWDNYTIIVTPYIEIPPTDVIVKEGSPVSASMMCVILGDYDISINPWTHRNATVKTGNGVTMEDPVVEKPLVIFQLTFTDVSDDTVFGNYTCTASMKFNATATVSRETQSSGSPTSDGRPNSKTPPLVTLSVQPVEKEVAVTEGDKVNIICMASGKPLPEQVTWQRKASGDDDFTDIAEGDEKYDTTSGTVQEGDTEKKVFNLTIKKVTKEIDGSQYKCDQSVVTVDPPPVATLKVEDKVTLSVQPVEEQVTVTEGDKVNIICMASGKPLPEQVTWQRKASGDDDFTDIAEGDEKYNTASGTVQEGDTEKKVFNLTIKKVTKEIDGSQYKCDQSVVTVDPPPVATLKVEDKVTLSVQPVEKQVTATVGDKVNITCMTSGKPLPEQMTWQLKASGDGDFTDIAEKDDKYAMTSDTVGEGDTEKKVFNLTIKKVTKEMNGSQYMCDQSVSTVDPPPVATLTVKDNLKATNTESTETKTVGSPVHVPGMAIAVIVLVILCGVVYLVYWKRHTLRAWLMDKDVVKVIKKQKRAKGYRYSKLPSDITTSMKHLE